MMNSISIQNTIHTLAIGSPFELARSLASTALLVDFKHHVVIVVAVLVNARITTPHLFNYLFDLVLGRRKNFLNHIARPGIDTLGKWDIALDYSVFQFSQGF